ncbi:MAG TPA: flagellar motor switch protein FliN, partial [Synergistaceae bacterium]|nr:flagellar motor switch protein FliN [Synergistaceae bacterium]
MVDELLSQDEIDALLSGPGSSSAPPAAAGLSPDEGDVLGEVANIIANAGGNVVGMLAGRAVTATVGETTVFPQGELAVRGGRQLLYTLSCDGFDNAPAAMALPERGALIMADLMMGGDGKDLPGEANDLYLSASQEGLSQMVGSAFTSISGLLKGQRLVPA